MTAPQTVAVDSRRRLLVLIAGGITMGVLLFLGSRMLSGGDAEEEFPVSATSSAAAASPPVPVPAPVTDQGTGSTVETFEVFTTKNPFVPLRSAAAPVSPATTSQAVPASVTTSGPAPAATPAAATAASGTATATASGASTASGGQATEPGPSTRVALLDVFADGDRTVANVRVNDVVSKVGAGDAFASSFKVVSLDGAERCGRFLYGDDQFRMCKGEEILK